MQVFAKLKEYEGRLASLKRAASRSPRTPEATYNLGMLHLEFGYVNKAAAVFEQLLKLHPEFSAAQERLTEIERVRAARSTG